MAIPGIDPALSERGDALIRVRAPGDLLDLIPYLLGFHPSDSVVLVGLVDGTVLVSARLDLADVTDPSRGADRITEAMTYLTRAGATAAIGAIFLGNGGDGGDMPDRTYAGPSVGSLLPQEDTARAVFCGGEACGLPVLDVLLTTNGRWWSYACTDSDCCPPQGRRLLGAGSASAASATFAGMVALPARDDLGRLLDPEPDSERLRSLIESAEDRAAQAVFDGSIRRWRRSAVRALFAAARSAQLHRNAAALDDDRMAGFAAALNDIDVRDSVWRALDLGRLPGRELWQRLATGLPAPYNAPPLFLFGWSAWREGRGPLAGIAATRALASDPGYTAAQILLNAVGSGLDPFRTPRLRARRPA